MIQRLALLTALGLVLGCAKGNMASLEVIGVCSPSEDCSISSGKCDKYLYGRPILDVANGRLLTLQIQVTNQLPNNADATSNRENTHDAYMEHVDVEYESDTSGVVLDAMSAPTSGTAYASSPVVINAVIVDPDGGAQLFAQGVPAFNPTTLNFWELTARVKVRGVLNDMTTEFETASYDIPFLVCNGCLGIGETQQPPFCAY